MSLQTSNVLVNRKGRAELKFLKNGSNQYYVRKTYEKLTKRTYSSASSTGEELP